MTKPRRVSYFLMLIGWPIFLIFSIVYPNRPLLITGWMIAVAGVVIYFYDFVKIIRSKFKK